MQEQSFRVSKAMTWFHALLVVSCVFPDSGTHQLLFFRRDGNLDLNKTFHRERLDSPIVTMNMVIRRFCAVYLENGLLRLYGIAGSGKTSRIYLAHELSLDALIRHPRDVSALSWVHHSHPDEPFDLHTCPFLVLAHGELGLVQEQPGAPGTLSRVHLNSGIEFFWIAKGQPAHYFLHTSVWAFDARGVFIWQHALGQPLGPECPRVHVNLVFYAVAVLLRDGILLGLEPKPTVRKLLDYPYFKLETVTHLFIPQVLQHLLNQGHLGEAITFSAPYKHLEYFSHALELLLHAIIDKETTLSQVPSAGMLPTVLGFLEQFPDTYLEVIVRYARKSEVSVWEDIFSIVGDAKQLFQKCLDLGAMETAASYLIIIQTLEPVGVSSSLAEDLLCRVFDSGDFE
jgi:hypothetical protein